MKIKRQSENKYPLITDPGNYRFQEKQFFAEVRDAPSRASDRQKVAREGASRTTKNIFLNAIFLADD
jgi:hypothetical protein